MLVSNFIALIHQAYRERGNCTIQCGASDIAGIAFRKLPSGVTVITILTRPTSTGVFVPIPPPTPDPIEPKNGT